MIKEELLSTINESLFIKHAHRITEVLLPTGAHTKTLNAVKDVSDRMNIGDIDVVICRGEITTNMYDIDNDVLFINERLESLLTEMELKAFITHELDHKKNKSLFDDFSKVARFSIKSKPDIFKRVSNNLSKARSVMEFVADGTAVELYGAAVIENALIKIMSHTDSGAMKTLYTGNENATVKEMEIALQAIAKGEAKSKLLQFDKRLRILQKQSSPSR